MDALLVLQLIVTAAVLDSAAATKFRNCTSAKKYLPPTVTVTTDQLAKLRQEMKNNNLAAYIIPAADQHQSEYTAPQAKRRAYMTGFKGSSGTAVVTTSKAALWTDGRYFDQAEMEMDCNWILQRQWMTGVLSIDKWLEKELSKGQNVGIDPKLLSYGSWKSRQQGLNTSGLGFKAIDQNLVDIVWTNKPTAKKTQVEVLAMKYTGKSWQDKVKDLRADLKKKGTSVVVLSDLADVAWVVNMRGSDIPYNPFFFAYVLVSLDEICIFIDDTKLDSAAKAHLCPGSSAAEDCAKIQKYSTVKTYFDNYMTKNPKAKATVSEQESYFIVKGLAEDRMVVQMSPVREPKAAKNQVEQEGMRISNLKDSVAITQFFAWLHGEIKKGTKGLTEISTSNKLTELKSKQKDFKGLSFNTIAAFGPNAATIHYRPNNFTDLPIDDSAPYLVDSGCQFPEGTTDITRTFHFGTPTAMEKMAFTNVLRGTIDLISVVFPPRTYGSMLDVLARAPQWRFGLDYNHGTGHGIGHFLSVHEGPQSINKYYRSSQQRPLEIGMVLSDEPGYYETGKFGIRLETDMMVVKAKTEYNFNNADYLRFEPLTFVPFCTRLTELKMLSMKQRVWLNDYNKQVRQKVGAELKKLKDDATYDWMMSETKELPLRDDTESAAHFNSPLAFLYMFAVVFSTIQCVLGLL